MELHDLQENKIVRTKLFKVIPDYWSFTSNKKAEMNKLFYIVKILGSFTLSPDDNIKITITEIYLKPLDRVMEISEGFAVWYSDEIVQANTIQTTEG